MEIHVERLPGPRWPARAVEGLEEGVDGPWPRAVRLDCRWRHGRAALLLSAALGRGRGTPRRGVGLRVAVQPTGRSLLWISIPPALLKEGAGGRVGVVASVGASAHEGVLGWGERGLERRAAVRGVALRSGLPLGATSRIEAFALLIPEGDVLPLPSYAFARIVHLALLELPFYAAEGAIDGRPPFDVATLPGPALAPAREGRRRTRLPRLPGGVTRYKATLDWLLAWIRDAHPTATMLREALRQRYDVTDRGAAEGCLRLLEGAGLIQQRDGFLEVTPAGKAYRDAADPVVLFEQLHAGYAGLLEVLTLADVPGIAGTRSHKRLLEGLLGRRSRTAAPVHARRSWLMSLGLIARASEGGALTPLGRRVLAAHQEEVVEIRKRVEDLLTDDRTADVERAEALAALALEGEASDPAVASASAEPAHRPLPLDLDAPPPRWGADRIELNGALARPHAGALELPLGLLERASAALSSGKHLLLVGPPGTGKTEIALALGRAAEAEGYCRGVLPATASADWTTFETIGGYALHKDGALRFRPGVLVAALEQQRWLFVDELNRADVDRAFGELLTVLAGGGTTTPYVLDDGRRVTLGPERGCTHPVPRTFRVLAAMNTWDKAALFRLSYALQRRFAIVHVGIPGDAGYGRLIERHAIEPSADPPLDRRAIERLQRLLRASALLAVRPIGPAIVIDMIRYARRRGAVGDGLAEAAGMFLLPQLEGLDARGAAEAQRLLCKALEGLASPAALRELTAGFAEVLPQARCSAS